MIEVIADVESLTSLSKKLQQAHFKAPKVPKSVDYAEQFAKAVADQEIGRQLLLQGLEQALMVEFSTIPLYLNVLWSIQDVDHPTAKSIRAIAHEEMLHCSVVANLITALGGQPRFTGRYAPRFPGKLPGGVHPELTVKLLGYSEEALEMFMEIERPEVPIEVEGEKPRKVRKHDNTIGEFYAVLKEKLKEANLDYDTSGQLAGPFAWMVIEDANDMDEAITLIVNQGEGSGALPFNRYKQYLSHYYRFLSMRLGYELSWNAKKKKLVKGDAIKPPSSYVIGPPPSDDYGPATPRDVRMLSRDFDFAYSEMLRYLEGAWGDGGHQDFLKALEQMFELRPLAKAMMRKTRPDGLGFCPRFVYVSS